MMLKTSKVALLALSGFCLMQANTHAAGANLTTRSAQVSYSKHTQNVVEGKACALSQSVGLGSAMQSDSVLLQWFSAGSIYGGWRVTNGSVSLRLTCTAPYRPTTALPLHCAPPQAVVTVNPSVVSNLATGWRAACNTARKNVASGSYTTAAGYSGCGAMQTAAGSVSMSYVDAGPSAGYTVQGAAGLNIVQNGGFYRDTCTLVTPDNSSCELCQGN